MDPKLLNRRYEIDTSRCLALLAGGCSGDLLTSVVVDDYDRQHARAQSQFKATLNAAKRGAKAKKK